MPSFRGKVISGVGWTFVAAASARLVHLAVMVILARILLPHDFGLFAMGLMIVNATALFRDYGLSQSLIYQKGEIAGYAHASFLMSAAFGIISWMVIYAAAPLVAFAFGNAELIWPLRVMSLSLIFSSLVMVPSALLEKELEFRKRALPEFANGLFYAAASITLAKAGFGAWSLVAGHIAGALAGALATWKITPYRPRLQFHRKCARSILAYARHLMAASVICFAFFYIDQAAVGRLLGAAALGIYSLAFSISNLPATNITHVVNKVMFPAYTRLNNDVAAMRSAYIRTLRSIAILSFPVALAIFVAAPDFVRTFFNQQWYPAIPLFQILAFYGMFRSIGATTGSIFMAMGQPQWVYRTNGVMLAIALPAVYWVTLAWGIVGVAILFTFAYWCGVSVALRRTAALLEMGRGKYFAALWATFIAAGIAAGAGWLAASVVRGGPPVRLAVLAAVMLPLYVVLLVKLDPSVSELARTVWPHLNRTDQGLGSEWTEAGPDTL